MTSFTIPGLSSKQGNEVAELLQKALSRYNDLHLTLKHVHWNVVGPNFIGVHEMIDPQVELVRGYADQVAERIAALGRSPKGTPGAIIKDRTWDDYSVERDTVQAHLAALDLDCITGAWIATRARAALADVEGTESHERHDVALSQRCLDGANRRIQRASGGGLGDVGMAGDRVDHFGFVHEASFQETCMRFRKVQARNRETRGALMMTREVSRFIALAFSGCQDSRDIRSCRSSRVRA